MPRIRINERFEIERDKYCWILIERVTNTRSYATKEFRERQTYHASIGQACATALDRLGQYCETTQELMEAWRAAVQDVQQACQQAEQAFRDGRQPKRTRTKGKIRTRTRTK